jgi:hypothetical protein
MKKIVVSDKFIEIYKNFNVVPQISKMMELSREELLLMLVVTFRVYDYNDVVMTTYKHYEKDLSYIDSVMFDSKLTDPEKIKMREIILENYLETDKIFDKFDNLLPEATTEEEAINLRRLLNINNILNS